VSRYHHDERGGTVSSDETGLSDVIDELEAEVDKVVAERDVLRATLSAMTMWLNANQPDVFARGLWDAIREGNQNG